MTTKKKASFLNQLNDSLACFSRNCSFTAWKVEDKPEAIFIPAFTLCFVGTQWEMYWLCMCDYGGQMQVHHMLRSDTDAIIWHLIPQRETHTWTTYFSLPNSWSKRGKEVWDVWPELFGLEVDCQGPPTHYHNASQTETCQWAWRKNTEQKTDEVVSASASEVQ